MKKNIIFFIPSHQIIRINIHLKKYLSVLG